MSGLGWKLRRLRAMSAGEILHRTNVAVRDRFFPAAYERQSPREAFASLYRGSGEEVLSGSRLAALVRLSPDTSRAGFAPEIAAADALMRGEWSVFGKPARLADPPDWSAHPWTGARWPDAPSHSMDYRRADIAGGARHAWETGRLGMLPTLALATRVTGDARYAECAIRWLDDFTERNPLGHGIAHTSGIEMAIRVINVSWTLALLGERAHAVKLEPCLGLVAQQALHCREHLSLGSSANNHLIAEYAAMTTLGALLPAVRDADALLTRGLAGLERETLRQFADDGVNREQSFGYLPFIWELLLYPFLAAEAAGRRVSPEVRERLANAVEFARVVRLPDGRMPQIGDEDEGRLVLMAEDATRLDVVGNALAAWLGVDGLSKTGSSLARLTAGREPGARGAADGRHEFADYTVWRGDGALLTFDHGPHGLAPMAAHGHADALSITLSQGNDAIVIDPGTFAYHDDLIARDRCRATPLHSTVHFGGRSQAVMHGPFLWESLPTIRREATADGVSSAATCLWTSGETHRRTVARSADGMLQIDDEVRGDGAELGFTLAPGARVVVEGSRARVTSGGASATFSSEGIDAWRIEPAECAPRFGHVTATRRLAARIPGTGCRTRIRIEGL